MLIFTLFLVFIALSSAFQLPSYLTKCKFNDENMAQCISDNIPVIRPHLKKGIKELGIPPLAPLHLDELIIDASDNFNIKMTDLNVFHLDNFEWKKIRLTPDDYHSLLKLYFAQIQILGTYDIDGKILLLPIIGHGAANITLYQFNIDFNYNYKPVLKNDKMHVKISNLTVDFHSGRIIMQLEGLFNGDKVLSDQVNAFLNENWRAVEDVFRPAVSETLTRLISDVFDAITDAAPLDDLFIL